MFDLIFIILINIDKLFYFFAIMIILFKILNKINIKL